MSVCMNIIVKLNALSSEMNQANSFLLRKLFKGEARRFSANFGSLLSCESPLKIQRYLIELLAMRILIANSRTRWRGICALT
jgi:hypothetical protein